MGLKGGGCRTAGTHARAVLGELQSMGETHAGVAGKGPYPVEGTPRGTGQQKG